MTFRYTWNTDEGEEEEQTTLDNPTNIPKGMGRVNLHPVRTRNAIDCGVVKGFPMEKYFTGMAVGLLPPRFNLPEVRAFYSIFEIPKYEQQFDVAKDRRFRNFITMSGEQILGIIGYSVTSYIVLKHLQGFSEEHIADAMENSIMSGKYESQSFLQTYRRITSPDTD